MKTSLRLTLAILSMLLLSSGCAKAKKVTQPVPPNVQIKPTPPRQPVPTDAPGDSIMTNVLLSDQLIQSLQADVSPTGNTYNDNNSCVQWVQDNQGDMLYFEAGAAGCLTANPPLPDPGIVKFKLTFAITDDHSSFNILGVDGTQVGVANWVGETFTIQNLCDTEMWNCQLLIDGNGSWQGITSLITGQSLSY